MKRKSSASSTCQFARALPAAIIAALLASCVTPKPPAEPEKPATPEKPKSLYEWNGTGRSVSHMKVNIDEQKVYIFSGKEQIGWATVATGLRSYPTPVGDYKVMEKVANKKSNLFGKTYTSAGKLMNSDAKMGRDSIPEGGRFEGATMPYYLRLTGDGVGMHAGPIPRPGNRASHGCIRMPRSFAPLLFASTTVGTPVSIVGDGPSYTAYLKKSSASSSRASKPKPKTDADPAATSATTSTSASTDAKPAVATTPAGTPAPAASEPKPAAPAMKEPALEIKPAIPVSPSAAPSTQQQ